MIRAITPKKAASDPEVIDYLRALLRIACNKRVEWLDIQGTVDKEYLDFYYPDLGGMNDPPV